ncbi:MAG: hypothetical protein EBX40_03235 [Gammaproteobacteria bacterium]|nr:hypothetical protein [Gammaproteobacteria bacterium]
MTLQYKHNSRYSSTNSPKTDAAPSSPKSRLDDCNCEPHPERRSRNLMNYGYKSKTLSPESPSEKPVNHECGEPENAWDRRKREQEEIRKAMEAQRQAAQEQAQKQRLIQERFKKEALARQQQLERQQLIDQENLRRQQILDQENQRRQQILEQEYQRQQDLLKKY